LKSLFWKKQIMPSKNLFDKPFDEGTIAKLEIFRDYFKEWLPVFITNSKWKEIQIFDFFAGQGKDSNGVFGSPMIIISILNQNVSQVKASGVKIKVILNEVDEYFEFMKMNVESIADGSSYEVEYYNDDFAKVFNRYYNSMADTANFMFLDQNGIKQISEDIFSKIIELRQTDFLFFISSSFINRFADLESFRRYLKITRQDLVGKSYYHIHRIVLNYYRNLIPKSKQYFLAPFSIKKPTGIYGLIFGSNHIYGLEKFLNVCWKHDKLTGEANFDIDNEKIDLSKPTLFEELNVPKKRQVFEKGLEDNILNKSLTTDLDVYVYTLNEGFLPKDANKIFNQLKEEKLLDNSFKVTSSRVHKIDNPQKIILKHG
jgi:three-Cys-motif partner protein